MFKPSEPETASGHSSSPLDLSLELSRTEFSMEEFSLPEFSIEDRRILLAIARQSIFSSFSDRAWPKAPTLPHLSEPRGVFTTLYLHGKLRGCVGYVLPASPLYLAVAETARAAASEDTRFTPVSASEASELKVSLSVLSMLFPIQPDAVELGRHGLMISQGGNRGLLLPQVPLEWGWDRETFLAETCRKAGLPANAWRNGASLEAFTAEVFSDADTA